MDKKDLVPNVDIFNTFFECIPLNAIEISELQQINTICMEILKSVHCEMNKPKSLCSNLSNVLEKLEKNITILQKIVLQETMQRTPQNQSEQRDMLEVILSMELFMGASLEELQGILNKFLP